MAHVNGKLSQHQHGTQTLFRILPWRRWGHRRPYPGGEANSLRTRPRRFEGQGTEDAGISCDEPVRPSARHRQCVSACLCILLRIDYMYWFQEDEGFILYESRAICRYLAERYADQGTPLLPKSFRERALVEQAASVELADFHRAVSKVVREAVSKV